MFKWLTLDFKAVGRAFGVPTWLTADLLRQPLEKGIVEFLVVSEAWKQTPSLWEQLYTNFKTEVQKWPLMKSMMQQNGLNAEFREYKQNKCQNM